MSEPRIRILSHTSAVPGVRRALSRRGFLGVAVGTASAAGLAACTPETSTPEPTETLSGVVESQLSIYTWSDYEAPDLLTAFQDDNGTTITMDSFNSNEEMVAKLTAAKGTAGYDLVVPTGQFVPGMAQAGLIQKLDMQYIPNFANLDPDVTGRPWDPDNEYCVCKDWGTTGFVYDTTVITRELTTWADFIDAAENEASGKVSVLDDPAEITGLYFWSHGINWMTTDSADLDAAEDWAVNEFAQHISAFDSYPGGGAIQQATHALMQCYNGDARFGILDSDEPDRWKWVLPADATEYWMDTYAIPVGAPHPNAAHAFINAVLDPDNSLLELDWNGYDTGVVGVRETAESEGFELLDMVYFTDEERSRMQPGEVTDAETRIVDIYSKVQAAAGQ